MRLSYHARTFIVECPLWDQILHRHRVIARTQPMFLVQLVGFHHLIHIQPTPRPGVTGPAPSPLIFKRRLSDADCLPARSSGCRFAVIVPERQRPRKNIASEISKRLLVRLCGQTELMAHLRHTYRALHRPEMRVRQRNIDRLQGQGAPI